MKIDQRKIQKMRCEIGRIFQRLRKLEGLSVIQTSTLLGLDPKVLREYELGYRSPPAYLIAKFIRAYKADWLAFNIAILKAQSRILH